MTDVATSLASIRQAIKDAGKASRGDSNDAEIDALTNALYLAGEALGIDVTGLFDNIAGRNTVNA